MTESAFHDEVLRAFTDQAKAMGEIKTEVAEGSLQSGDLVISDATLPAGFKPAAAGTGLLPGAGPPPGGPRRF